MAKFVFRLSESLILMNPHSIPARSLTRRSLLKSLGLSLAALAISDNTSWAAPDAPEQRPNIFFAIADDWGWPHGSAYGDPVVKTPTFDQIGRDGVRFQHAFVASPSCTPSRNSLLTGQHFWRLGPGANLWSPLPEEFRTFPDILAEEGYTVGSMRKVWGPGTDRTPPAAGEAYESFAAFLEQKPADQPFCFIFGTTDPHRPFQRNSGVKSGMDPAAVVVPPMLPDTAKVRADICDYYYEVQRFDREVGEQLRLLEARGELENTLVVMTGDHGWPFPRGKSNLYDLGVRVPLAVQWGARIQTPGRVVDDFVGFADFAPTLLQAAGVAVPKAMSGRSFLDLLESTKAGWIDPARDHALVGMERHTPSQTDSHGGYPMRAIRTRDYLYIRNFEPDRWPAGAPESASGHPYSDIDGGPTKDELLILRDDPAGKVAFELSVGKRPAEELYVVADDPWQIRNVADQAGYATVLAALRKQLDRELQTTDDPRIAGHGDQFERYPYLGPLPKPRPAPVDK
jgi:N-sulfoglucosamine sulfohydrolase